MLNTFAYMNDSTPPFARPATATDRQHTLPRETRPTNTSQADGRTPRHGHARQGRRPRVRMESLMLAPIWVGTATTVLAAMAELVRSA